MEENTDTDLGIRQGGFFRIDSPFMVESQGKMDVTLANIRWEPDTSR